MIKPEKAILKAAQGGDRDAYGQIVERYQSLICAITYNATGDIGLSEDIAQETFLTAWKSLKELRDINKLPAWLCGIARNILRETIRREKHHVSREPLSVETLKETDTQLPEKDMISKEEQQILWQSLGKIPDNYREPLILFYREQQSVKQVSQGLGLSEEAVRQRLSRGRKLLKNEVATLVEDLLGRTKPGKVFTTAVIAALPAMKADAMVTGLVATTTTGFLSAESTFWIALSGTLLGIFLFLLTGGYLVLLGFVGFSAILILKKPSWFENKRARILITIICLFVLALCTGLLQRLYWSVFFALLAIGSLLVLHPGCPDKVRFWFLGPNRTDPLFPWKKWDWHLPPKNWITGLSFFLSLTVAFTFLGIFVIYKTEPKIAWGLVGLAALMAINFAFLSLRLVVKVWSCHQRRKKN